MMRRLNLTTVFIILVSVIVFSLCKKPGADNIRENLPGFQQDDQIRKEFNKTEADTYSSLGNLYYNQGIADSALFYLNIAHEIYIKVLKHNDILIHKSYIKLANVYLYLLKDHDNSEQYYIKALQILESMSVSGQNQLLAGNLYSLAATYRLKSEYQRGIEYGKLVLKIADDLINDLYKYRPGYNKGLNKGKQFLINASHIEAESASKLWKRYGYSVLGNIYRDMKDYDNALLHYSEAIKIAPNNVLYKNNLALCYYKMGLNEEAKTLCNNTLQDLIVAGKTGSGEYSNSLEILGMAYENTGRPDMAIKFFRLCLSSREQQWKNKHFKKLNINNLIGQHYFKQKVVDSALYYFQQSLIEGIIGFSDQNINNNPYMDQIDNKIYFIDLVHNKSDGLRLKYNITGNVSYLKASLDCLKLCDSIINDSWHSFLNEESKLYLEDYVFPIYEKAVNDAFELYSINNDQQYIKDAFRFFEKNKYKFLLDKLVSIMAYEKGGVSDALIQSIRDIEVERKTCMQDIQEYPDNEDYRTKLANCSDRLAYYKQRLSDEHPEFYKIKFEQEKNLSSLQDSIIGKNTLYIQFFYTPKNIYSILTNGNNTGFIRIENNNLLKTAINGLLRAYQPVGDYTKQITDSIEFVKYSRNALKVYNTILRDQLDGEIGIVAENIIIIPDGQLTKLNFEALITELPDFIRVDYKALKYLLYDYTISTAYSSNIYLSENTSGSKRKKARILAFGYGNVGDTNGLSDLKWTNHELKSISKIVRGKFYNNKKATETNFKKYIGQYSIVHLALHGIVDPDKDSSTMLVFRGNTEDIEDGNLLPYELINLNINSKLVVLSSCESGIGKLHKGEGVYSMARAFAYSGCPSLVSTLWKINDKPSSEIMSGFYEWLLKDVPINTALRNAKLRYIENSNQFAAHPLNWASFIASGKMNKIKVSTKSGLFGIF